MAEREYINIDSEGRKVFSLSQVMKSLDRTISSRYTSSFWVRAEMMKLNYYFRSGHAYPDLVEKDEERIVAQTRAIIWKNDFVRINARFREIAKEELKDGLSICCLCRISFDAVHGLSLIISDIDPMVSLGELEKERRETIAALKKQDLFDKNKKLKLPLLPQRLAIISVETSKGYLDFMDILSQNKDRYKIFTFLFPSLLQGDKAVGTLIEALDLVQKLSHHFDAALIIRGGGGDVGLSCYNNYELSKRIAEFPLPVLTGIGHSTNETVSEMVAYKNAITPTELADFMLEYFRSFEKRVADNQNKIINISQKRLELEKLRIRNIEERLKLGINNIFDKERERLSKMEKHLELLNPNNLLKRGYAIVQDEKGRIIKEGSSLSKGDRIITRFQDGSVTSIVDTEIEKNK